MSAGRTPSNFARATLLLAAMCVLLSLWPAPTMWLLAGKLRGSLTPEHAIRVASWGYVACAVALAVVGFAWRRFDAIWPKAFERLLSLQDPQYWTLVILLALLPRLALYLAISYEPVMDAAWFHEAAASLAQGNGFSVDGAATAYRPPGYPLLLAATYRWFGPDFRLAWVWGLLSTASIVFAIHELCRVLHGRAAGRLAALAAAVYPALVLMTGQVMSDLPFLAALLLLSLFVLRREPYGRLNSIALGGACALLTLTRGVAIGLVVVLPLMWYLRRPDWRSTARCMLVSALVFSLGIAPWIERNHRLMGSATLGTNVGTNLYAGNHEGSDGGAVPVHWPEPASGAPDDEAAIDRSLLLKARSFVLRRPGAALRILPRKLLNLYALETEAVTALFQGEGQSRAWLKHLLYVLSQASYALLVCLLALRLPQWLDARTRPSGAQWTGLLLGAYFTALCLVFHGEDRYRLPILPWMLIEAAAMVSLRFESINCPIRVGPFPRTPATTEGNVPPTGIHSADGE